MAYDREKRAAYMREWRARNREKWDSYMREWRGANAEHRAEYAKQYRKDNIEQCRKWDRERYRRDHEKRRAACRAYPKEKKRASDARSYQTHKKRRDAANRAWAKANPEQRKQHMRRDYEKHKDRFSANGQNRRARKAGAEGSYTEADIKSMHKDQRGRCAYCGAKLNGRWHVDHFVPLSKGGTNWPDNLRLACGPCNLSKGNRLPR